MIDFQNVFYGVCGLLAAIAITQPKFYVKYASYLLVAAFVNMVLVLVVTLLALVIANKAGEYRDGINLFARYFSEFLLKIDNYQALSYMALLFVVWGNLLILSRLIGKYEDDIKKQING
ncbi:hypothetical protein [Aeromonas piscicola]|uniref:hypothetical protein n=1 Tax=Aeromonas piscicola TaxID=600645 RepID=UPI0028E1A497|nr:hypothetical protein [Aeromonas piscicola]